MVEVKWSYCGGRDTVGPESTARNRNREGGRLREAADAWATIAKSIGTAQNWPY